jgi:hypothetical protein
MATATHAASALSREATLANTNTEAKEFYETLDRIIEYAQSAKDIRNLRPEEYAKLDEIATRAHAILYGIVEATTEVLRSRGGDLG